MKKVLYTILPVIMLLWSCKKEDKSGDVNPVTQSSATIGDKPFNPSTTHATTNSSSTAGYDVVLKDGETTISISTSAKEKGTYTAFCATCRVDSTNRFSGTLITPQGEFRINSGTVEVKFANDGTLEIDFSFDAVNNNSSVSVKDGKVRGLAVSTISDEEHFKSILKSKTWYMTKYEFEHGNNESTRTGDFVKDAVVTGITQTSGGKCDGTHLTITHTWNHYMAKFTESTMIGQYSFKENEQKADTNCNVSTVVVTKSDTRNKSWSYNSNNKTLTTDFGNPFDITEEELTTAYTVVSYTSSKIVLEGVKTAGNGKLSGKIVLE